jgi:hypothetical protein
VEEAGHQLNYRLAYLASKFFFLLSFIYFTLPLHPIQIISYFITVMEYHCSLSVSMLALLNMLQTDTLVATVDKQ